MNGLMILIPVALGLGAVGLAAFLWLVLASRRRCARAVATLAAGVAAPYGMPPRP